MLQASAATVGGLWVAPALATLSTKPAAASTAPPTPTMHYYSGTSAPATMQSTIDLQNLNSPGMLVGAVAWTGSGTPSSFTPGWTLAGEQTVAGTGGVRVYTRPRTESSAALSVGFTSAVNLATFMMFYPTAIGWQPAGSSLYATGTSTLMQPNTIATTGANRRVIWIGAWADQTGATAPSGFDERGYTGSQHISMKVADRDQPAPNPAVGASAVTIANVRWYSGLLALYA